MFSMTRKDRGNDGFYQVLNAHQICFLPLRKKKLLTIRGKNLGRYLLVSSEDPRQLIHKFRLRKNKMIKRQTYVGLSLMATLAVVYHAFSSRYQFYPAMVYLSTSKISLVLLLNFGLANMCILWQLTKKIFLGTLREAEVERLNEQTWREVMETLFAITIFRQDFSVSFLAMVTTLLLIKALHWLAQQRVEFIETTPAVPLRSHVRIVSFMAFLLLIDSLFLYNYVEYLVLTKQASVSLFFAFEYMILATTTMSIFIKYAFYVSDVFMDGQWEGKAAYTFYLELIRDLLHLSMYLCFFLAIFVNYGVPLHLIRELYETFRNFKSRVADYLRYRRITSNMNDRFPDATPDELNSNDTTCIICREEMTTAKKLLCGHYFHVHCLRSWLERQHTCPTCRAPVIPSSNGPTITGVRVEINQQGTSNGGSSSNGSGQVDPINGSISLHQARLQAAATATSIYEKSFIYPSVKSPLGCVGKSSNPGAYGTSGSVTVSSGLGSGSVSEQSQIPNMPFAQQFMYVPIQVTPGNIPPDEGSLSNISMTAMQMENQINILEHNMEVLQQQLKNFKEVNAKDAVS